MELALLLPILLGLAGGATDLARAYQAQITLESAVRNAAEYVAANSVDGTAALADARRSVCLETTGLPGFVVGAGGDAATCTAPAVSLSSFGVSTTATGGTVRNPLGSATVQASLAFHTLIDYPFLPHGFNLSAIAAFTVARGR